MEPPEGNGVGFPRPRATRSPRPGAGLAPPRGWPHDKQARGAGSVDVAEPDAAHLHLGVDEAEVGEVTGDPVRQVRGEAEVGDVASAGVAGADAQELPGVAVRRSRRGSGKRLGR